MARKKYDNSIAPFRRVTMTTLRNSLNDCVALLMGHIEGPAQRKAIIAESIAILGDHYAGPADPLATAKRSQS